MLNECRSNLVLGIGPTSYKTIISELVLVDDGEAVLLDAEDLVHLDAGEPVLLDADLLVFGLV